VPRLKTTQANGQSSDRDVDQITSRSNPRFLRNRRDVDHQTSPRGGGNRNGAERGVVVGAGGKERGKTDLGDDLGQVCQPDGRAGGQGDEADVPARVDGAHAALRGAPAGGIGAGLAPLTTLAAQNCQPEML